MSRTGWSKENTKIDWSTEKDESMANLLKKYCSILSDMIKTSFKY